MSLVAGSYERFIWGYKLKPSSSAAHHQTLTLTPQFSYAAHLSPIKSLAVAGHVAASTAGDDAIKLYDLTTSTELGSLLLNSTSATTLSFFSPPSLSSFPRNLIAGADDGTFHIIDVDPFVHLKSIHVHRKSINDLAVHPSGRLALSVSRDAGFAMVNLVRGRRSFVSRLEKAASIVEFSRDGGRFFLCCEEKVTVHEAEDARIVGEFEAAKRVLCAAPRKNGLILTGGEDCGITAWDTVSGKVAYSIADAHKTRVKGVVVLSRDGDLGANENPFLIASASSDGVIRVWDVRACGEEKSMPLTEANTKSRITCLAGSSIKSFTKLQMKKDIPENIAADMQDS